MKLFGITFIMFGCCCSVVVAINKRLNSSHSQQLLILNDVVTEIICYLPKHVQTIAIIADEFTQTDSISFKKLLSENSVLLIDKEFTRSRKIVHTKKIDVVIIIVRNYYFESFGNLIAGFIMTPWRTPLPTYLLIDYNPNNCYFAKKMLQVMWKFRIISYLLCLNKNKIFVMTFNPFSEWAPHPWHMHGKTQFEYTEWTLLTQKYNRENLQKYSLDFNRMKIMDKYQLIVGSATKPRERPPLSGNQKYKSRGYEESKCGIGLWDGHYMRAVAKIMNLTIKHVCTVDLSPTTALNGDMLKKKIFQSEVDIIATPVPISRRKTHVYIFEQTFPTFYRNYGILTISRGFKTPVDKIRDFYGIWIGLFTIFVLLVTFIVVYLFEKRRAYFATFETIRLLINTGLLTKMETFPLRMFFTIIFLYFLILQATFNGNLTNFLTKPVLKKHAETPSDLKDLGYDRVYGVLSLNYLILEGMELSHTVKCWRKIENRTNAACIDDYNYLRVKAWQYRPFFHLSKKPFSFFYQNYFVRSNWPLLDKVNLAIMELWQTGLQNHWEEKYYSTKLLKSKVLEATSLFIFAPIQLENLMFVFIILGVGLSCATLAFIIELSIFYVRYKCCYKKNR